MVTRCIYANNDGLKDERPTSNVQRRTSNNDVAPLSNLISFVFINLISNLEYLFLILLSPSTPLRAVSLLKIPSLSRWSNGRFDNRNRYRTSPVSFFKMIRLLRHLFSHSTFDVGRSMFDVHPFSVRCSFLSVNLSVLRRKNKLALMRITLWDETFGATP